MTATIEAEAADRFEALYRAHAGPVRDFIADMCGDHAVDDLTAETFMRALREAGSIEAPSDPGQWLRSQARSVVAEYRRSASVRSGPEDGASLGSSWPDAAKYPDEYVEALRVAFFETLRRYVLGMCRNSHVTDDVVSETFERALCSVRRGAVVHDSPLAWLRVISKNLLTDHFRRAASRHEFSSSTPPVRGFVEAADASTMQRESLARLADALRVLTPGQRQAVVMRTINGYSTAETAFAMGRSEQAVRSLIHKAMRSLADHYRTAHVEEFSS